MNWIKKIFTSYSAMRFYLVSFKGEGCGGSIWFNYAGFPSHLWIKEQITKKFPRVRTPAIMHIQELSRRDYNAFTCTTKTKPEEE
jgi:hypothetical protein